MSAHDGAALGPWMDAAAASSFMAWAIEAEELGSRLVGTRDGRRGSGGVDGRSDSANGRTRSERQREAAGRLYKAAPWSLLVLLLFGGQRTCHVSRTIILFCFSSISLHYYRSRFLAVASGVVSRSAQYTNSIPIRRRHGHDSGGHARPPLASGFAGSGRQLVGCVLPVPGFVSF
jgi:hypothetical protein